MIGLVGDRRLIKPSTLRIPAWSVTLAVLRQNWVREHSQALVVLQFSGFLKLWRALTQRTTNASCKIDLSLNGINLCQSADRHQAL